MDKTIILYKNLEENNERMLMLSCEIARIQIRYLTIWLESVIGGFYEH